LDETEESLVQVWSPLAEIKANVYLSGRFRKHLNGVAILATPPLAVGVPVPAAREDAVKTRLVIRRKSGRA
jgi:hypothetical protein